MRTLIYFILMTVCSVSLAQYRALNEDEFLKYIHNLGAEKALKYFKQFQLEYPDSILFKREAINNLGWNVANNGNICEAIKIFELNLFAYPEHFDPWDSYAEAILLRGEINDIDLAIKYFKKSAEINPNNSNAKLRLLVLENYFKEVYMIPMRDGVKLYTQIYIPKDKNKQYPILYKREWYSVKNYGPEYRRKLHPNELFVKEGFIFVHQDIRGRFMSEGDYEVLRPYNISKSSNEDIDESTDAYDTVDWLLNNLDAHNGKVGVYGGSYSGWASIMVALEPHPAVKAVSAAASPADWWMGDDMHHNGAFRLMYAYSWVGGDAQPREGGPSTKSTSRPEYKTNDGYRFFLDIGPIKNVNEKLFKDKNITWNEYMAHGDYDHYWEKRNLLQHIDDVNVPILNIVGWFDAEDFRGPLMIYESIEKKNPDIFNSIVIGPWMHGGWNRSEESLGDISFKSKTGEFFQKEIELPFFMHYLKNSEYHNLPEAFVFQTGKNQWKEFDTWPPPGTVEKKLYLEDNGRLLFEPLSTEENHAYDEFLSDPGKPVPWSTAIQTQQGHAWMISDQRFAYSRPDVLVYESEPLKEDLTIAGPITAHLNISTSGTDADWIVKVIDVLPNSSIGKMSGYQMLLAGDVFRSKYRKSFKNPMALIPNCITKIEFSLFDKLHTFKKGHKIMIQIQSSWFPVIDRNPQVFCNIYEADEEVFQKAFHRVYHSKKDKSYLIIKKLDD